uniref:DZF domain-containing protein n=1 Tax=Romanomermis culicivorax TaxID=13658 RepID=A0A915HJN9_ROMCU
MYTNLAFHFKNFSPGLPNPYYAYQPAVVVPRLAASIYDPYATQMSGAPTSAGAVVYPAPNVYATTAATPTYYQPILGVPSSQQQAQISQMFQPSPPNAPNMFNLSTAKAVAYFTPATTNADSSQSQSNSIRPSPHNSLNFSAPPPPPNPKIATNNTILGLKRPQSSSQNFHNNSISKLLVNNQQSVLTTLTSPCNNNNANSNNGNQQLKESRKPFFKRFGQKLSDRQTFFCDTCKITCMGETTYKEHLEGQKHKKKVIQSQSDSRKPNLPYHKTTYKCNVCDVTCSGKDSYDMHAQGVKHQRAVRMHLQRGKPSSECEPTIIQPLSGDLSKEEEESEPIGEDYIEYKTDGNPTGYRCKLCDCQFTDVMAKNCHLKGRRHKLQYKMKVDPTYEVEPSKMQQRMLSKMFRMRSPYPPMVGRFPNFYGGYPQAPVYNDRQPDNRSSNDEIYLCKAHEMCRATEDEIGAVERVVCNVERALKMVSDALEQKECSFEPDLLEENSTVKKEIKTEPESTLSDQTPIPEDRRILKGTCTEDQYDVAITEPDKSRLTISSTSDGYRVEVTVYLTAVIMRSAVATEDLSVNKLSETIMTSSTDDHHDDDTVLDKEKCLEALASLRRAKWFQSQCAPFEQIVQVLRILKDYCKRTIAWRVFPQWGLELLVERIFSAADQILSPSELFRHFFESIACGLLLPGTPGFQDPCEKEYHDVFDGLTQQQAEDITFSA